MAYIQNHSFIDREKGFSTIRHDMKIFFLKNSKFSSETKTIQKLRYFAQSEQKLLTMAGIAHYKERYKNSELS